MGEPKSDFTKLDPLWSQVVAKPSGTMYKCTLSWIDAGEEPDLDFTECEHGCEHHLRTHPPVGPEGPSPPRGAAKLLQPLLLGAKRYAWNLWATFLRKVMFVTVRHSTHGPCDPM